MLVTLAFIMQIQCQTCKKDQTQYNRIENFVFNASFFSAKSYVCGTQYVVRKPAAAAAGEKDIQYWAPKEERVIFSPSLPPLMTGYVLPMLL